MIVQCGNHLAIVFKRCRHLYFQTVEYLLWVHVMLVKIIYSIVFLLLFFYFYFSIYFAIGKPMGSINIIEINSLTSIWLIYDLLFVIWACSVLQRVYILTYLLKKTSEKEHIYMHKIWNYPQNQLDLNLSSNYYAIRAMTLYPKQL